MSRARRARCWSASSPSGGRAGITTTRRGLSPLRRRWPLSPRIPRCAKGWTMSSATSTSRPDGFTVGHLFVLLSLIGATIAVVIARPATPESLILVSLTIGAVGFAAVCFYCVLAPLVAPHSDFEQEPLGERLRTDLEREKALTLR